MFYEAVESEEKLEELENFFGKNFNEKALIYHPALLAYTGAIDALKAKHAFNPFTKFSRVLSSLNTLEVVELVAGEATRHQLLAVQTFAEFKRIVEGAAA